MPPPLEPLHGAPATQQGHWMRPEVAQCLRSALSPLQLRHPECDLGQRPPRLPTAPRGCRQQQLVMRPLQTVPSPHVLPLIPVHVLPVPPLHVLPVRGTRAAAASGKQRAQHSHCLIGRSEPDRPGRPAYATGSRLGRDNGGGSWTV